MDNIRYGQAIDNDRDKELAVDDHCIPDELKTQAEACSKNFLIAEDTSKPGQFTQLMREIGKNARNSSQ